ncbi:hypothetical protein ACFX2I_035762 [Malus domestica]
MIKKLFYSFWSDEQSGALGRFTPCLRPRRGGTGVGSLLFVARVHGLGQMPQALHQQAGADQQRCRDSDERGIVEIGEAESHLLHLQSSPAPIYVSHILPVLITTLKSNSK